MRSKCLQPFVRQPQQSASCVMQVQRNSPSLSAFHIELNHMGYTSRSIHLNHDQRWVCGPVWLHVSAAGAVANVECVVWFDLQLMVLALLSKGHILHFNQSPLIALTVCPPVTEQNKRRRGSKYSMSYLSHSTNNNVLCDEVMVIISFMLNSIAWPDMTFTDPEMYVRSVQVILQHQYL